MIEKVYENIYSIKVPLPKNPLKELNAYLIKGDERNLLVDTGFNREECETALKEGLMELGASPENTDVFITHMHADHCGLIGMFDDKNGKIYASDIDSEIMNSQRFDAYWERMADKWKDYIEEDARMDKAVLNHPARLYCPSREIDFTIVDDGDVVSAGPYNFECIAVRGHTPKQICLYEKKHKILFSADHILNTITPNISLLLPYLSDPLGDYLNSLDKIEKYNVKLTLPAHRDLVPDMKARVEELREHHHIRINETLEAVRELGQAVTEDVAKRLTWRIRGTWDEFPPSQWWFAIGETGAHLDYLYHRGTIAREKNGRIYEYSIK